MAGIRFFLDSSKKVIYVLRMHFLSNLKFNIINVM